MLGDKVFVPEPSLFSRHIELSKECEELKEKVALYEKALRRIIAMDDPYYDVRSNGLIKIMSNVARRAINQNDY